MARSLDFKKLLGLLNEECADEVLKNRRDFLKKAALAAGAVTATAALPACGTFDRWVLGDSNQLNDEVMVLGAGIAGLSAAYHLKRNKTPYRVYEASDRVGGRVQTLFHANSDNQFAELGAEFFEASHKMTVQLCKDLGLAIQDISYDSKLDRSSYWLNGKVVSEKEFRKNLKPLVLKLALVRRDLYSIIGSEVNPRTLVNQPLTEKLDVQSLADFLSQLRGVMDAGTLECFENMCISEWGVDSKNINLLHFLVRLDLEEKTSQGIPTKIFRIEGGMSRLIQVLGERVQGIVPDATLKLSHQIVAIRAKSGGYECTFKMNKGSDTVWARQVICALPWSILKDVDGIQNLDLGLSKELIAQANYATHSKVISSFKDPQWKKKSKTTTPFQGALRGQLIGQSYWDSSRGQSGTQGLLTSQRGGAKGLATGATAAQESLQDLRRFFKEAPAEDTFHISNWQQKPFAKGSRLNLLPGNYLKFLAAMIEDRPQTGFYLAGEHMSFLSAGTMNGAIETAHAAAEKAIKKIK
jgi:monoamine oxidase